MEGAGEGATTVASVVARSRIPVPWGFVCPARRGFAGFESKPTTGHVFGWGGRAGTGSTPCCDSKGHARACRMKTHKRERERKFTHPQVRWGSSSGEMQRVRRRTIPDTSSALSGTKRGRGRAKRTLNAPKAPARATIQPDEKKKCTGLDLMHLRATQQPRSFGNSPVLSRKTARNAKGMFLAFYLVGSCEIF